MSPVLSNFYVVRGCFVKIYLLLKARRFCVISKYDLNIGDFFFFSFQFDFIYVGCEFGQVTKKLFSPKNCISSPRVVTCLLILDTTLTATSQPWSLKREVNKCAVRFETFCTVCPSTPHFKYYVFRNIIIIFFFCGYISPRTTPPTYH